MKLCESCKKEHDGSYGSGRFCSRTCSNKRNRNDKNELKTIKCINCNNDILVKKNTSNVRCLCDKCKDKKNIKYCKVCGSINKNCKRPDICLKWRLIPALNKYFGLDISKLQTLEIYEEFDRIKNLIIEEYWVNLLSVPELAEKYHHNNPGNLSKILTQLNIDFRNMSQSQQNSLMAGKKTINTSHLHYKHGYHTTWNNKEIFYRSSYELEFAKILDVQKVDYEVEKLRILYWDTQLLRQRVAIPDFYLPETNEIIEVKSIYTYDPQNMNDKIKSYKDHGYKFKLWLEKEFI